MPTPIPFHLVTLAATLLAVGQAPAAADTVWPARVTATYKAQLAGIELGTFNFTSTVAGNRYTLTGNSSLSWGFGMFRWQGDLRSSGTLASAPKPSDYAFDFNSNGKPGSVKLGFRDHDVVSASVVPENSATEEHVPLKPQHLKDVFDPLSALLAMSHAGLANPCGRRIPIFDGKQRFDLVLSFRRQVKIKEARPSGEPGIGYVCRVQYLPIAGHRDNEANRKFATNQGIEVTLRPVASANLLVPYEIVIPTAVGQAVLRSRRVDIVLAGDRRIGLTH